MSDVTVDYLVGNGKRLTIFELVRSRGPKGLHLMKPSKY
jgi:hypothetical protein